MKTRTRRTHLIYLCAIRESRWSRPFHTCSYSFLLQRTGKSHLSGRPVSSRCANRRAPGPSTGRAHMEVPQRRELVHGALATLHLLLGAASHRWVPQNRIRAVTAVVVESL